MWVFQIRLTCHNESISSKAIIWKSAVLSSFKPLETNISDIWIPVQYLFCFQCVRFTKVIIRTNSFVIPVVWNSLIYLTLHFINIHINYNMLVIGDDLWKITFSRCCITLSYHLDNTMILFGRAMYQSVWLIHYVHWFFIIIQYIIYYFTNWLCY